MVRSNPCQAKSAEFQQQDGFLFLEREKDREASVYTMHANKSRPPAKSHASRRSNDNKALQLQINELKRKLRNAWQRRDSSSSNSSSRDEGDDDYRQRSRTLPSESFSHEREYHRRHKHKDSSHGGPGNDTMSKALHQISKSPFTCKIEAARLPRSFHQPMFTIYNGRMDPVEHISHFNQRMAVHSKNETLMCKVFPSSLGPVAIRWFDDLKAESIDSFQELTSALGSRFITCSRVPRPLGSLLSLSMREGETLKAYSDRYWEMFNEIDGKLDDVAVSTFKLGLPAEHRLRKSLTGKPVTSVCQLMDWIDKYKRVEEDQLQEGKTEK